MNSDTLAPGTLVAGRYRIVRELGRGGMGAVYVVEHVNTGGLWALKVMLDCTKLQAERAARFRREARASARITSEHVVKVTDADTAAELDGAPFIVMELLDGQDVERLLAKCDRLDAAETIDILSQVARGLDKAHAAGVIHRDLKPENIFVHRREDGSTIVKVLDFGISKVLRPDGDMASASVTGAADVMGTPLYMAPEQATARHDQVGPATDVWAIGLMAVRMLTGSVYWKGDTIAEVFVQIMSESRWPPSSRWPELGPAFDAWFTKSCAPRVTDRFQSVGEQISELTVLLTGERPIVKSMSPARPPVDSAPPQLRTQIMSASDKDKASQSSSGRAVALGVSTSTAEPVTRPALPLKPARGLAIGAALVLLVVVGFVSVALLRGRSPTAIAGDSGAMTSPTSAALGSPGATTATGNETAGTMVAAADAGHPSTTLTPLTSLTPATPTTEPASPASPGARPTSAQAPGQPGQPGQPPQHPGIIGAMAGNGARNPPRPPQAPGVTAPTAPPPPASVAPSAKPPAKPGDLFDTQK